MDRIRTTANSKEVNEELILRAHTTSVSLNPAIPTKCHLKIVHENGKPKIIQHEVSSGQRIK